jgi:hypothetical protein
LYPKRCIFDERLSCSLYDYDFFLTIAYDYFLDGYCNEDDNELLKMIRRDCLDGRLLEDSTIVTEEKIGQYRAEESTTYNNILHSYIPSRRNGSAPFGKNSTDDFPPNPGVLAIDGNEAMIDRVLKGTLPLSYDPVASNRAEGALLLRMESTDMKEQNPPRGKNSFGVNSDTIVRKERRLYDEVSPRGGPRAFVGNNYTTTQQIE